MEFKIEPRGYGECYNEYPDVINYLEKEINNLKKELEHKGEVISTLRYSIDYYKDLIDDAIDYIESPNRGYNEPLAWDDLYNILCILKDEKHMMKEE